MRVRNDHSPCLSSLNLEAKWGATSHQGPGGPCRLPAAPLAYEGQALPLTRPRLGRRPSLLLEPGEPSPAPRALPSLPWGGNHGMHCRGHAAESVLCQLIARGVHSQRAPASPRASGASPAGPSAGTWPHSTPHSQPLTHVWSQLRSVPPREDSGPSPRGVGPTHRPRPLPPWDSGDPPTRLTATRGVPVGIPTTPLPRGRTEAWRARSHRTGSARGDGLSSAAGLASLHWAPRWRPESVGFPWRPAPRPRTRRARPPPIPRLDAAGPAPGRPGGSSARPSMTSPGPPARVPAPCSLTRGSAPPRTLASLSPPIARVSLPARGSPGERKGLPPPRRREHRDVPGDTPGN